MKFPLICSSILAAGAASDKVVKRQTTTAPSVSTSSPAPEISVLLTALPSSLLALAETNPASASELIASELEHSQTPSWYQALPSGVKTYLLSEGTMTATTTSIIPPITGSASSLHTGHGPAITSSRASSNITTQPGPVIFTTPRTTNTTTIPLVVVPYNTSSMYMTSYSTFTTYTNASIGYNGTVTTSGTVASNFSTTVFRSASSSMQTTGEASTVSSSITPSSISGSPSSSTSASASTSSSTGGAPTFAIPTAVFGTGIAGAMAVFGLLAL